MSADVIPRVGSEHLTLTERVYRELRSAILHLRIAPGQQLRSEDLSSRLGVSRTPVKEALSRLRVEGLVEYSERHGFSVVQAAPGDLPDIYEAQMMLALSAVEKALPSASAEDLQPVRQATARLEQTCRSDPPDRQAAFDVYHEFHRSIVALGRNECALDWFDQLTAAAQFVRLVLVEPAGGFHCVSPPGEHEAIVQALERRDADLARAAIQAHSEAKLKRIFSHLER